MAILDYAIIGNLYYNICEDHYNVDISRLGEALHSTVVQLFIQTMRFDPLTPDDIDGDEVGPIHEMYVLSHILDYLKNDYKSDSTKSALLERWIPTGLYTNFTNRCKKLAKELYDNEVSPRDLVYRQVTDRNANNYIIQ